MALRVQLQMRSNDDFVMRRTSPNIDSGTTRHSDFALPDPYPPPCALAPLGFHSISAPEDVSAQRLSLSVSRISEKPHLDESLTIGASNLAFPQYFRAQLLSTTHNAKLYV